MGRRRVLQSLTPRALPRFFVAPTVLETRRLPDDIAHQVGRVLRLGAGDWICLLDGTGGVYLAELGEDLRLERVEPTTLDTEPPLRITVLQSLVRPEKVETVIRLCTQSGAAAIWLAPSERSVARVEPSKHATRIARWQKIAQEEAELAARVRTPQVQLLLNWQSAFEQLARPILLLDEFEGVMLLKQRCRRMPVPETLSVVVGPEGGFSPEERAWMQHQPETYPVSLGARVLRTEHAAFYALAQIMALWE